jgi:hypothetical protein
MGDNVLSGNVRVLGSPNRTKEHKKKQPKDNEETNHQGQVQDHVADTQAPAPYQLGAAV